MTGLWFKQPVADVDSAKVLELVGRGDVGAWGLWILARAKSWCTANRAPLVVAGALAYLMVSVPAEHYEGALEALDQERLLVRQGDGWALPGWAPPDLGPASAQGGAGEAAPASRSTAGRPLSMKPSAVRQRHLEERRKAERERQASGVRSDAAPDAAPDASDVRSASEPDVRSDASDVRSDASPLDSSPPSGEREKNKKTENTGENAGKPAPPGGPPVESLGVSESVRSIRAPDARADATRRVEPIRRQPQPSADQLAWARAWADGLSAATGKPTTAPSQTWAYEALGRLRELNAGLTDADHAAWLTATATRYRRAKATSRLDQSKGYGPEMGEAWLNAGEPADEATSFARGPARTAPPQPIAPNTTLSGRFTPAISGRADMSPEELQAQIRAAREANDRAAAARAAGGTR